WLSVVLRKVEHVSSRKLTDVRPPVEGTSPDELEAPPAVRGSALRKDRGSRETYCPQGCCGTRRHRNTRMARVSRLCAAKWWAVEGRASAPRVDPSRDRKRRQTSIYCQHPLHQYHSRPRPGAA